MHYFNSLEQGMACIDAVTERHQPRAPVEPNYSHVLEWEACLHDARIARDSNSWLFANEYYRMTLEGEV